MIDYEIRIDDPETFTKPWTMRMTITSQPGYQIYEYNCHEGNHAMRNALSAERAYEKAAAEAKEKGLAPPERVFERVNGADRARSAASRCGGRLQAAPTSGGPHFILADPIAAALKPGRPFFLDVHHPRP
jgi:hypothetical protein